MRGLFYEKHHDFQKKEPLQSAAALFPVQLEKEVRLFMGECVNGVYDTFSKDDKLKHRIIC